MPRLYNIHLFICRKLNGSTFIIKKSKQFSCVEGKFLSLMAQVGTYYVLCEQSPFFLPFWTTPSRRPFFIFYVLLMELLSGNCRKQLADDTTKKQGDSDGRSRQKFVGIDRFRRISDDPVHRYLFVGKKIFVRISSDLPTTFLRILRNVILTIFRCGHTRPEFIGKTIYRRRTFLGLFRRIVGVGIYRQNTVRRYIPTN